MGFFLQCIPHWSRKKTILCSNRDRKRGKTATTLHTAQQVNPAVPALFYKYISNANVRVSAARVGPSVPRQERPARDGARVASIETGLAAAAAKLSHQVCPISASSHEKCEK